MDWSLFWSAISAIGQVVATILAIGALVYSIRTFDKSVLLSHFSELDAMYSDLLRIAIDKPHLRTQGANRTPEQALEYEYYAHMSWCFVESVYDRAKLDKKILPTWFSAIDIETRLHREWLDRPENAHKFKREFRKYIGDTFPVHSKNA